jgi:predicted  nucleic acid-binding Zn-ribbon protein
MSTEMKPKSFWQRPEGITGMIFLAALIVGGGYLLYTGLPILIALAQNTLYLAGMLLVLGAIVYMVLDPKVRNLVWFGYKSIMRTITGLFVQLDPIGILKSYVDDLQDNLRKMNKQISKLRGQMHKLQEIIHNNKKDIQTNLSLASKAKTSNKQAMMILKTRKAGRLKESNVKLEDLHRKMEVLYRVLTKMYENSQILMEDIKDQVSLKEQERKIIHTSHSAMRSAMSVISGDPDKRAMFDMAMEAVADDVANKVGEMERFMEMSSNFMDSVDLQNGIFEEEGLKMLEKWEKEGVSLLLGEEKENLLIQANSEDEILDLDAPIKEPIREPGHRNQYDNFFES